MRPWHEPLEENELSGLMICQGNDSAVAARGAHGDSRIDQLPQHKTMSTDNAGGLP